MLNWKTLLSSIILVIGIASKPLIEKRAPTVTEVTEIVGAVSLGYHSKDKDVTGIGLTAHKLEK